MLKVIGANVVSVQNSRLPDYLSQSGPFRFDPYDKYCFEHDRREQVFPADRP